MSSGRSTDVSMSTSMSTGMAGHGEAPRNATGDESGGSSGGGGSLSGSDEAESAADEEEKASAATDVDPDAAADDDEEDSSVGAGDVKTRARVGVAFSERFARHASPRKGHEERPARLEAIKRELERVGLWHRAISIDTRRASDEELRSVHSKGYVRKLARLEERCRDAQSGDGDVEGAQALCDKFTMDHEDVYLNMFSIDCARLAVGACIESVEAIQAKKVDRAVAIVRPPGHHAEAHCAQGFCIFNNVALAAKHAVEKLGLSRVLIVDWDVHHGNGTQHAFYQDPRVLYFSVHRFDFGRYYPALEAAGPMATGRGVAAGTNVNVAWNGHGFGDAEYLMAWDRVLMPIAREFAPQMVIVSAGFDAAEGDRMGRCKVSPDGFAVMTREMMPLADGKILLVLEGGYNLSSLAKSLRACTEELFDQTSDEDHLARLARLRSAYVRPEAIEAIEASIRAQKPYWSALTAARGS